MSDNRFMMLQFFADGAAGGDGGEGAASTGDNAADAGRDLEALGVPRDKAERYRQRMDKRRAAEPAKTQPQQKAEAPAANDGGEDADEREWNDFMSKDAHKNRLQQMMAERGKAATEAKRQAEEQSKKFAPAIAYLGSELGLEADKDGNYDEDSVIKAVLDRRLEDKALAMGVSKEVARKLEEADELDQQKKQAEDDARRRAFLQEHFNQQLKYAEPIKNLVPGFDLEEELDRDPEFRRLTAPGLGRADQVYFGLHYNDILKAQAASITQRAKQAASANVAAGGNRPRENGSSATAAVTATPDMRKMTRDDRIAYIKRKYPPRI